MMTTFSNQQTLEEIIDLKARLEGIIEKGAVREVQGEVLATPERANAILSIAKDDMISIIEGNNPFN